MPRYELTKTSYLRQPDHRDPSGFGPKLCKLGTEVEYIGWPGTSMKPLDAEAEKMVAAVAALREANPGKPLPPFEPHVGVKPVPRLPPELRIVPPPVTEPEPEPVPRPRLDPDNIPDDWRTQSWPRRRTLALKLGGTMGMTSMQANEIIAAHLKAGAQS